MSRSEAEPGMSANVIFCDDIRIEETGKQLLIGVYPNGIALAGILPSVIRIVAWLQVFGLKAGDHELVLTLTPPRGASATQKAWTTIEAPELAVVPLLEPFELYADAFGDIEATLSVDAGPGQKIGSINLAPAIL